MEEPGCPCTHSDPSRPSTNRPIFRVGVQRLSGSAVRRPSFQKSKSGGSQSRARGHLKTGRKTESISLLPPRHRSLPRSIGTAPRRNGGPPVMW